MFVLQRYFITFFIFLSFFANSQEFTRSVSLQVDNDLYFGTDKYYSSGIILGYGKVLENGFLFRPNNQSTVQLQLELGHKIFTPGDIDATNNLFFDRPFAGWLYGEASLKKASEKSILKLGLEIGATGNASFGEDIQVWYHRVLGIEEKPSWFNQIPGELMANFKPGLVYSEIINDMTYLDLITESSLGTKDFFAEQWIGITTGSRNNLPTSSAFGLMGTTSQREFYFFGRAGLRWVGHDSFLEGSWLNDNARFTVDAKTFIFKINAGVHYAKGRHVFDAGYFFNTKASEREASHSYLSLVYKLRF